MNFNDWMLSHLFQFHLVETECLGKRKSRGSTARVVGAQYNTNHGALSSTAIWDWKSFCTTRGSVPQFVRFTVSVMWADNAKDIRSESADVRILTW